MKFVVQKKGQNFIVSNDTTGYVRGVHKTEGEAKLQAQSLQQVHDEGIKMVSATVGPKQPKLDSEE